MTQAYNWINISHQKLLPLLIGFLCIFLSSCNYFESQQSKLQKAKKLYDDNKFNESIILAKNILQSDPKSCEARILLGQNQFAQFSLIDAQDSFKKAKNQDCKDLRVFNLWVKSLLYRNKIDEAKALYTDPYFGYAVNRPENIILEGDLYFIQKNYDKAKEIYARYYNSTHDKAGECLSQTKLLAMQNNFQEVINKSIGCEKLYSDNHNFNLNQSRFLRAIAQANLRDTHSAITTLNTTLENYSNSNDQYIKIQSSLLLMKLYLTEKDVDNAAKIANALLKYIAMPDMYHVKGLKAEKDKKLDIAEQQFLMALKINPQYEPSLLELANIKFKEGNIEQAKYYTGKVDALTGKSTFTDSLDEMLAIKYLKAGDLDAIIKTLPNDKASGSVKSKFILALAYAKKGDQENAWKTFHTIENRITDKEKLDLLRARLYIALGDAKNAEEIFRQYLNSGNTDAVLGLSQLYIQQHKYDAAEKLLISALSTSNDKYGETLLLVELYSTTNQKQKIFDLLNQAIKSTPKNHIYQILLAKVYYQYAMYQDAIKLCDKLIAYGISDGYKVKANSLIMLGKNADAKQVLNTLSVKEPNSAYAYVMLSYLAVKEKNHDAAMSYIDKALEVNPRNLNAVYTKLELLLNNKQNDEALKFAKSAASLFSDTQTNNLLLGFVYSRLGDTKNAYLNYLNAQDHGNLDVRLAVKTYKLSVEINGKEQASKEFDQWLEKNQNAENVFYAANYFLDQNDYKMAEKCYELYLTKNQNNPTVYNNLAWLKLEQGKTTDALNYANKAFELAPSSPAVMDTLGLVLLKTGEYDKAGSYLLSAYQQLNDNPSVKYHLALFYYHKNNFDKSRSILQGIEHVKFAEQADAQKLLAEVNKHN